jgi:uncharacterized protein
MKALNLTPRNFVFSVKQLDRVWFAITLIFAVIALADFAQLPKSIGFVTSSVRGTFGFLVVSVSLTAYAKASGADNLIGRAFSGSTVTTIFSAALMGALSPFCSCGVIPIIVALLAMGVPLAPVMAFWLASPLMDPSMFFLTTATLGMEFAIAKTVAAVSIGLLGGFVTYGLVRSGFITEVLKPGVGNGGCAGSTVRAPKQVVWKFWRDQARIINAKKSFKTNLLFLAKWLILAFVLESLMVAYLPNDLIYKVAGGDGFLPILIASLVGVPSYLNGYAALPLVKGLLAQGLSPGAAMSFLMAGGVTSLPAAMAVWAVARGRVFAAYIGLSLVGAVASGIAFRAWQ